MAGVVGNTPQNQINALPLRTVVQAASDGDIQVVGGTISRYWNAAVLGINGINAQTVAGHVLLASAYINTLGCSRYTCLLRRVSVANAVDRTAFNPFVQYRKSAADTPPAASARTEQSTIAKVNLLSTGIIFPNNGALAIDDTCAFTWSSEAADGSSANGRPLAIGYDCRIIIDWSTGGQPPGANDFFTMTLWGQT